MIQKNISKKETHTFLFLLLQPCKKSVYLRPHFFSNENARFITKPLNNNILCMQL